MMRRRRRKRIILILIGYRFEVLSPVGRRRRGRGIRGIALHILFDDIDDDEL
jgi:hypothetical protein